MKTYVIELNNHSIRTIKTNEKIFVGLIIPDEIWLGHKIPGGKITKILK